MDLSHPLSGGADQLWKRDVGVANVRFHELWVEFLRAVWTAIENAKNRAARTRPTMRMSSRSATYLRDLLQMRRRGGNLAREEFVHVATLSWFHLTVDLDTPVMHRSACAGDRRRRPADQARRPGGNRPPAHARELFEMAELASGLVRFIELGYFGSRSTSRRCTPRRPSFGTMSSESSICGRWRRAARSRPRLCAWSASRWRATDRGSPRALAPSTTAARSRRRVLASAPTGRAPIVPTEPLADPGRDQGG